MKVSQATRQRTENLRREYKAEYSQYERAVHTLLAFSFAVTWDPSSSRVRGGTAVYQGLKMFDPAGRERTPDLVIRLDKNSGVVAELKKSLPKNKGLWAAIFEQIEGYCRPLSGWDKPAKEKVSHAVAALFPFDFKDDVAEFLEVRKASGKLAIDVTCGAFAFFLEARPKDFWTFELFWTEERTGRFPGSMKRITSVPFARLMLAYGGEVKFIDDKPPLLFLAQVIWDNIFSSIPSEEEYRANRGGVIEFPITPVELTKRLNLIYSFSSILHKYGKDPINPPQPPQAIRKEWVVDVLNFLKKHKLAEETDPGKAYKILFKKLRPNTLDHLITCMASDSVTTSNLQETLPLES